MSIETTEELLAARYDAIRQGRSDRDIRTARLNELQRNPMSTGLRQGLLIERDTDLERIRRTKASTTLYDNPFALNVIHRGYYPGMLTDPIKAAIEMARLHEKWSGYDAELSEQLASVEQALTSASSDVIHPSGTVQMPSIDEARTTLENELGANSTSTLEALNSSRAHAEEAEKSLQREPSITTTKEFRAARANATMQGWEERRHRTGRLEAIANMPRDLSIERELEVIDEKAQDAELAADILARAVAVEMYQDGAPGASNPGTAVGDAIDIARLSAKWTGFDDTLESQLAASERILRGTRSYALHPLATITYTPLETSAGAASNRLTPREHEAGTNAERVLSARIALHDTGEEQQLSGHSHAGFEDSLTAALGPVQTGLSAPADTVEKEQQSVRASRAERHAAFPLSAAQSLAEVRAGAPQTTAWASSAPTEPTKGPSLDR